jgi:hypothetical protein
VSFVAISLSVASQRVFVVYLVMTQSENFWIYPRMSEYLFVEREIL